MAALALLNATHTAARKTFRAKMHNAVITSSACLAALLLLGHLSRRRVVWLRALHLPSSLLGGIYGWAAFLLLDLVGDDASSLSDEWFSVGWDVLPGFCTNLVFCCLFLGTAVPSLREVLEKPRLEHLLYGLIVVFGQYVVSAVITGIASLADPQLPALFATVMPYGFAGGPVVAEAMLPLYAEETFNYPAGYSLALLAATVGMFAGVILGALLVNVAPLTARLAWQPPPARIPQPRLARARVTFQELKATANASDHFPPGERPVAAVQTVSNESLDSLMFHLCLVASVMLAGYILRLPFVALEELFPADSFLGKSNLLSVLPLFLFCLISGLAIQKAIDVSGATFVDRPTIVSISNTAQDVLIVAAIARLGRSGLPPEVHGLGRFFAAIFEVGIPFVAVCIGGLVWGVISFWWLGPRLMSSFWAERALTEFGVSIGATSTGLLLLRMADPDGRTPVLRDFTCKQIFHVLITGGGFFDVLVPIPLCAASGSPWPLAAVSLGMTALCLLAHPSAARTIRRIVSRRARGCLPPAATPASHRATRASWQEHHRLSDAPPRPLRVAALELEAQGEEAGQSKAAASDETTAGPGACALPLAARLAPAAALPHA
ncbi:hypothetical protein AB1Y20_006944 [Prymnesium parvum]|uniref:Sodium/glutamate symporter n=1 Tax=Prymnesium parvum TaxID=97485 RepID=A0AB34J0C4_PRYPA